jgi:hypothetical protein
VRKVVQFVGINLRVGASYDQTLKEACFVNNLLLCYGAVYALMSRHVLGWGIPQKVKW